MSSPIKEIRGKAFNPNKEVMFFNLPHVTPPDVRYTAMRLYDALVLHLSNSCQPADYATVSRAAFKLFCVIESLPKNEPFDDGVF